MALIIDVETTGLPDNSHLSFGENPRYTNTRAFDSARIVQITMMLCNNRFKMVQMKGFIVKSEGFRIQNAQYHGITDKIAAERGVDFDTTVLPWFVFFLSRASHIVAHNADFDIAVLKSELFRRNQHTIIEEINSKTIFCTMRHAESLMNLRLPGGDRKSPSLAEFYRFACGGKKMENKHNSNYDVMNLHKAITTLYNDNNKLQFYDKLIFGY